MIAGRNFFGSPLSMRKIIFLLNSLHGHSPMTDDTIDFVFYLDRPIGNSCVKGCGLWINTLSGSLLRGNKMSWNN